MSTDIVERYRKRAEACKLTGNPFHAQECDETADLIATLREALGKTEAALDKMHQCSIVGAALGYTQPELWGDALYASHHDAFEALKTARALLPKDKP